MSSIASRVDRLEQTHLTGYQAALQGMSDEALLETIRTWDLATWGRILAQAEPDDAEMALAVMRQFGPGTR